MVFSSSKSGTLNPALNGLYLLMRHMDHNQIFTRPGSRSDLGLVQIWVRSVGRIKRYSLLSAGLCVPSKHHSEMVCAKCNEERTFDYAVLCVSRTHRMHFSPAARNAWRWHLWGEGPPGEPLLVLVTTLPSFSPLLQQGEHGLWTIEGWVVLCLLIKLNIRKDSFALGDIKYRQNMPIFSKISDTFI